MEILLIRHAKSINYERNLRQSKYTKLGEEGKKQSNQLSKLLKKYIKSRKVKFDLIITSEWRRAKETSLIVSKQLRIPIRVSKYIHEFISSSLISNKSMNSSVVKEFNLHVKENSGNLDWKYNNEGECTRDVIKRAISFKQELTSKYMNKNLIVISHGFFITVFLVLIILGEKYSDSKFKRITDMFRFNNCSLTKIKYDSMTKMWSIDYINSSRAV